MKNTFSIMRIMVRSTTIFILFVFLSIDLMGQYQSRGKEHNYHDAESFYAVGNYYDALPLYEKLAEEYPKVHEYKLKAGVCHIYLTNTAYKAIEYLEDVYQKKAKTTDVAFYLAKAYALNYKFDDAIAMYESALENKGTTTKSKKQIPLYIQQCKNAKELIKDSLNVNIVNLGSTINSSDNEYSATVNADESLIIYTYKGPKSVGGRQDVFNKPMENGSFYEDVYSSAKINGEWTVPNSIGENINSEVHEASISLSPDGQNLYLYKDTRNFSGDIFVSKKEEGIWEQPEWLAVNSEFWEGHAAVSPAGSFMIFSSERPGGIGGKDLYSAKLLDDGSWGEVENLGPTINTPYNDDAPFIHSDGVTFNFCSEGHSSMGGYDIFESKILEEGYAAPRNIGYPINTTSNDIFFYVSGRGNAYYSSARKGGFGQQDIYVINVKDIINSKPVLLVTGVVTTNDKFEKAKIVVKTESGTDLGTYYTDVENGKYQFYVDLNDYYVITYEVEGFPAQVVSVDATQYTEYTEIEKNINFNSSDVSIKGVALSSEQPYSPIVNMHIQLSNKGKTFTKTEVTDSIGRYNFSNLPNDDYYLLFLDENDEKQLEDSSYIFKGEVLMNGLPYSQASINETSTDDNGEYRLEIKNKFYGLLNTDASILSEMTADDIMAKYGDQTSPGLVFKIQVAAYKIASNYTSSHLEGLGDISKTVLDDGITRFTIGQFATLREAKSFEQKAKDKGQDDAFVIMFINGKRTYLEELINSNLFK